MVTNIHQNSMRSRHIGIPQSPSWTGSSPELTPDEEQRSFSFSAPTHTPFECSTIDTNISYCGNPYASNTTSELRALVSDPHSRRYVQQQQCFREPPYSISGIDYINMKAQEYQIMTEEDVEYQWREMADFALEYEMNYPQNSQAGDLLLLGADVNRDEFDQYLSSSQGVQLPSHELTDLLIRTGTVNHELSSSSEDFAADISDLTCSLDYSPLSL